jgi:hypothetical protein
MPRLGFPEDTRDPMDRGRISAASSSPSTIAWMNSRTRSRTAPSIGSNQSSNKYTAGVALFCGFYTPSLTALKVGNASFPNSTAAGAIPPSVVPRANAIAETSRSALIHISEREFRVKRLDLAASAGLFFRVERPRYQNETGASLGVTTLRVVSDVGCRLASPCCQCI